MRGDLLQKFSEVEVPARLEQGPKIVRVAMQPGQDLLAKRGSMIAYEGLIALPRVRSPSCGSWPSPGPPARAYS